MVKFHGCVQLAFNQTLSFKIIKLWPLITPQCILIRIQNSFSVKLHYLPLGIIRFSKWNRQQVSIHHIMRTSWKIIQSLMRSHSLLLTKIRLQEQAKWNNRPFKNYLKTKPKRELHTSLHFHPYITMKHLKKPRWNSWNLQLNGKSNQVKQWLKPNSLSQIIHFCMIINRINWMQFWAISKVK